MSQDISAGDSTPKLVKASTIEIAKALNLWYKFIELSDDFTNPIQFNKGQLVLGSVSAKNTATDFAGFKVTTTTTTLAGQVWGDEANGAFKIESGVYPLYLNAAPAASLISLRIANAEQARLTTTGLGIGQTAVEKLSVGTTTAGTGSAIGIYALSATSVQSYARMTQDPASGNLTFAYGQGTGGTGKYLVFSGNAGGQIYMNSSGDLGINNAGQVYAAYSGSRYLSIKGGSNAGAIELSSNAVDAGGILSGAIYATDISNTGADKRLASFEFGKDGTTAANRGGFARLMIKADGVNGLTEAWRVSNTGQMSIGVNAPFNSTEVLRVHKSTGARISLTDSNNASFISSVPSSTSSELALGSNNTEAVRIDKNQNLGIQVTAPAAKLDIGGNAAATAQAIFARGADLNYQMHIATMSGTNVSGDALFQFGTRYSPTATLTGGMTFTRGAASTNMTLGIVADSVTLMTLNNTSGIVTPARITAKGTMGRIQTQTSATTAGIIVQTSSSGLVDQDGAFITYVNKDGSKAFALGMDYDGILRVGGGIYGSSSYAVYHEGYSPGAMVKRGTVQFADADLYRQTGLYVMQNPNATASYSLVEYSDIGDSSARIQMAFLYGNSQGAAYSGDEMYFRVARDTQTNWDGFGVLSNRVWHSSNLIDPVTKSTDYATPNNTYLRAVDAPTANGETYWSTPSYKSGQGDGRTHFGYLYNSATNTWHNYLRGDRTISEGTFASGPFPFITGRAARYLATYAGGVNEYGITLNNIASDGVGIAMSFCAGANQSAGGTTQGSITTTASAVAFNTTSDLRLKTNVRPSGSALDIMRQIQVISFDFSENGDHVDYGFGAQQLQPLVPTAVKVGNEGNVVEFPGDVWQVDHSKLVPLLTKALQETDARLEKALQLIADMALEIEKLKNKA